ncbi:unnamed protein product [Protopolystoma xenopodis]|uniref:Kynureninase n=1 Tax=Protopolystoma xenopodis TaxID=117903 RepID=A0A448WH20_9PLAT|nr:unnamed protein product [Protopolystoma xenopodis]
MTNPLRGPQLTGWWGHRDETRFAMTGTMQLATGAAGYRISNPPLLLAASLRGQLDLLAGVPGGMEALRAKSVLLTGYLIHLITCSRWSLPPNCLQVVTPRRAADRGAQVTLRFVNRSLMPTCFMRLKRRGFICDYRVPDNIRVSPAPLYNTFRDVYHFAVNLYDILSDLTATT